MSSIRCHVQLLAGAKVNELTKHRQTALHLAAQQDLATICSVLLENGVDFAAVDENGNNGECPRNPPLSALLSLSVCLSADLVTPTEYVLYLCHTTTLSVANEPGLLVPVILSNDLKWSVFEMECFCHFPFPLSCSLPLSSSW